jgi:hypothetical protein
MSKKKFYQTDSFKILDKEWKRRLKESGFVDIESSSYSKHNSILKSVFTVNLRFIVYNRKCRDFLNSGVLTDPVDIFILEKHCEGNSNRSIEFLLGESSLKPLKHTAIDSRLINILKKANIEPVDFTNI